MAEKKDLAITEGYGLAAGYTVVERATMRPISAQGLGLQLDSSWALDRWGPGMRLSTDRSEKDITAAGARLWQAVKQCNDLLLERSDAMLLPGGSYPYTPIDERGSLSGAGEEQRSAPVRSGQSWTSGTTLEIPFADDPGFGRLHTAVRMVLPLLPALTASSPFSGGLRSTALSARTASRISGHPAIPQLTGSFIPELALDQADYYRIVLEPIALALADQGLSDRMDYHTVNARAAVPLFDRATLAVDLMDTQECASMDAAVAEMTAAVVQAMKNGRWVSNYLQRAWHESDLLGILNEVVTMGREAVIDNRDFLLMFGKMRESSTAGELWRHLYQQLREELSEPTRIRIAHILDHGNLAERILRRIGDRPSPETLVSIYRELAVHANEDRPFL